MKRFFVICLALLTVLTIRPIALANDETTRTLAVNKALYYLKCQQQSDGSYVDFDGTINATSGAGLAIAAARIDLNVWKKNEASTIDYLQTQAPALSDPASLPANTGKIAQIILLLEGGGRDSASFAGTNWINLLKSTYSATAGSYGSSFVQHPWVVMALCAGGETVPPEAVGFLKTNQEIDGGFGFNGAGSGSDTNTTAICLEALAAAGVPASDPAVEDAVGFLHTQQNSDGGFPWAKPSPWGTDSDSSSTAWVIQGLIAAGEDPDGPAWTQNGQRPVDFLMGLQNANGSFGYQLSWPDDNLMSTYQVIPALLGKTFPLDYLTPIQDGPVFVALPNSSDPINIINGQIVTANPFTVLVRPSSPFGITYVELYIDGVLVGTATSPNDDGVYSFAWDTAMYHSSLEVIAHDTLGDTSRIIREAIVVQQPAETQTSLPYTGR